MSDKPPLRARLHWYQLSAAEFTLLTAMCEACSDGSVVFAAIPRLAAYARLSPRHVRRLIHGYIDKRTGNRVKGFLERGILTQLAAPGSRKRTATYRINEDALHPAPTMRPYLSEAAQQKLPGILKPAKVGVPQRPIGDETPSSRTLCPPSTDTVSAKPGHGVRLNPDTVSADSKAFDSKASDSKAGGFKSSAPALLDCQPEDLARDLCERIAFPATRSNVEVLAAVLKVIKTKQAFPTFSACCEFLELCVKNARSQGDLKLELKPRFFFEDGDYVEYRPIPTEVQAERLERLHAADPEKAPECIVGKCQGCGRPRLIGSSWSDYCADSCRDAHKRATA